jgi:zinc/manganese transport system substrate-binding protein
VNWGEDPGGPGLPGRLAVVSLTAFVLSVLAGCGGAGTAEQQGSGEGRLRVVATYSILGDLVENVGGENIEMTTLVGPNGDAHTFEPSPSDSAELSEAKVVFENGLGFETWLDDLYESSGSEARRVVATRNVEPLPIGGGEAHSHEDDADELGAEEGHEHGEFDPHVWHDVANAMTMVRTIREALIEADPRNAEAYRANAERYLSELEELDAEVTEKAESVPQERRILFTSHDTFGYFAERYGFEVDTALASVSTEASDPSAGETAEIVEEIEASGVPAVFVENVSNPDVMERIAQEAGVEIAPPLYTDALGEPGSEGGTYVEMERYNATTIAEALGG